MKMNTNRLTPRALVAAVLFASPISALAIITNNPSSATDYATAPSFDGGWQYVGQFSSFVGTAIAPNYFITAKHIGQNVGQPFFYQGTAYTTTEFRDVTFNVAESSSFPNGIASTDLRVWKV